MDKWDPILSDRLNISLRKQFLQAFGEPPCVVLKIEVVYFL